MHRKQVDSEKADRTWNLVKLMKLNDSPSQVIPFLHWGIDGNTQNNHFCCWLSFEVST